MENTGAVGMVGRALREADLTLAVSPNLGHQEEAALVAHTQYPGQSRCAVCVTQLAQHVYLQLAPSANFGT